MASDFALSSGRSSPCNFAVSVASEIVTPGRRRASVSGATFDRGMSPESEIVTPRRRRTSASGVPLNSGMSPERSSTPSDLRFDVLRLREWFNKMDSDRCGHVSKRQFMRFIVSRPQLQKLLVDGQEAQLSRQPNGRQEEAVRWRRLSTTWQELCDESSKEGQMGWTSFVEFFRRRGMLLEYKTKGNPKERLASMLADMHAKPLEQQRSTVDEFVRLRRSHLQGQQQRELGQTLNELGTLKKKKQEKGEQKRQLGIQEVTGLTVLNPPSNSGITRALSTPRRFKNAVVAWE